MARKYRHFVYDENQRFIYPTSDWGFKYLLGTEANKDILIGILKKLLPELGIESLEFLPRDITIPVGKLKDARFDVHCSLCDGSRAVIEMQNYVRKTFLDRSLVYTAAAVLENYVNSNTQGYKIGRTIFIAFLSDPLFRDVVRTPVRLGMCDLDEVTTTLRNEKVLQIFVELPKFAGGLENINENTPFVEKLAYVLMEMADCKEIPANLNDPLLEKLFHLADTSTMRPEMKEDYMKSVLGQADYEYHLLDAHEAGVEDGYAEGREEGYAEGRQEGLAKGRQEGLAKGRQEGLAEGREEGLAEGRQEGLAEGRQEGLTEGREEERKKNDWQMLLIVRNLKNKGFSAAEISDLTGLPEERVGAILDS